MSMIRTVSHSPAEQAPPLNEVTTFSSKVNAVLGKIYSSRAVQLPIRAGKSTVRHVYRNKFRYGALGAVPLAVALAYRYGLLKAIRYEYFNPSDLKLVNQVLPALVKIPENDPIKRLAEDLLNKGLQGLDPAFSNPENAYSQKAIRKAFMYLIQHRNIDYETACKMVPCIIECTSSNPWRVANTIATTALPYIDAASSSMMTAMQTASASAIGAANASIPYVVAAAPYIAVGVTVGFAACVAYNHFNSVNEDATPTPLSEEARPEETQREEIEVIPPVALPVIEEMELAPQPAAPEREEPKISTTTKRKKAGKPRTATHERQKKPLNKRVTLQPTRTQPRRASKKAPA